MEQIFIVEITDCSSPGLYWYHDKIGERYECRLHPNNSFFWPAAQLYKTVKPIGIHWHAGMQPMFGNILPRDCKIVVEKINNSKYSINNN